MGHLFGGGAPSPRPAPVQQVAPSARALLPGTKADVAARTGGGISPQFIQNILAQQGANAASLDVLNAIRESLGQSPEGAAGVPSGGGGFVGAGLKTITDPELLRRLGGTDITL